MKKAGREMSVPARFGTPRTGRCYCTRSQPGKITYSCKRPRIAAAACLVLLCVFSSSAPALAATVVEAQPLDVCASFNAMAELAKLVGDNLVNVSTFAEGATEPHEFEPGVRELGKLSKAELFITSGLGMEPWAERAVRAAGNKDLKLVVCSEELKGVALHNTTTSGHRSPDRAFDPHLWLSPKGAAQECEKIKEAFCEARPDQCHVFEANYQNFAQNMQQLLKTTRASLEQARQHTIVTAHAAFSYLAADLGLTELSVRDAWAGPEPGARKMAELIREIKKLGLKVIFTEAQSNPALAKTLANECQAKVEYLYTMETAEGGLDFTSRMEENLNQIRKALVPASLVSQKSGHSEQSEQLEQ